ncbi:ABC transporter ATP-binding protein [Rapidithrix thailandica]|uniref:ABC transporter ATP-binding protein n=1 Tax=Rapidithrix thailandica TaxID=413964 RepID=A0AAW9SCK5_9BACT
MNTYIQIEQISKSYQGARALREVRLEVQEGELFGLIGPDGAGKTSLIRILATLLLPDSGTARMGQKDVVRDYLQIRKRLGYMPGKFSLYQDLTVRENLELFATLFGTTIRENYGLIKDIYVQLEPFNKRLAGKLSGGMKQKLALCCALIHRPEVMLLDEPTTGVDPVSRKEFWQMLKGLQKEGITLLVSTPYMDEAKLCQRVALIQSGQILQTDSPEGITRQFPARLYAVNGKDNYQLLQDLRAYPYASSVFSFGEDIHYTDEREEDIALQLNEYLRAKGHTDHQVNPIVPSIEDCFMELMKQSD